MVAQAVPDAAKHDAVVVLHEERWSFAKDGEIHHNSRFVFQVLTARGVKNWSALESRWEPWHQQRPSIRARVVTADGVSHDLDQKTIVEAAPRAGDSDMFSDLKILRCPLPAVAPGAVVEEEIVQVSTPILTGETRRVYLTGYVPVQEARVILEYPDNLPLHYDTYLLPDLKPTKTSSRGMTRLLLETGALPPAEDVEPMLPPDVPSYAQIIFSTGSTWHDLAAAYQRSVEAQIAGTPVAAMVQAAVAGTQDRAQIISRLVRELHK